MNFSKRNILFVLLGSIVILVSGFLVQVISFIYIAYLFAQHGPQTTEVILDNLSFSWFTIAFSYFSAAIAGFMVGWKIKEKGWFYGGLSGLIWSFFLFSIMILIPPLSLETVLPRMGQIAGGMPIPILIVALGGWLGEKAGNSTNRRVKLALTGGLIILLIILAGIGVYLSKIKKASPSSGVVACTEEAKQCSDGSYVSRTGPNCAFALCPTSTDPTANWETYKNTSLGYELKYPTPLRLIEVANLGSTILTDMKLDEPAIYPTEENVLVEPVGDQTGSTPVIYKGFYFKIQNKPRLGRYTALHLWEKINVNGLNVYKTEDSFKSGDHEGKYISIVWEDSRGNQYEANASFNASKKDYLILFNQILSTFRFLDQVTPTPSGAEVCAQVITPARNPATGECREFPTPCDVPEGWVKVESCPTPQ